MFSALKLRKKKKKKVLLVYCVRTHPLKSHTHLHARSHTRAKVMEDDLCGGFTVDIQVQISERQNQERRNVNYFDPDQSGGRSPYK